MHEKIEIVRLKKIDNLQLTAMVRIHQKVLRQSFLNHFGPSFLHLVYESFSKDIVNNIMVVAVHKHKIVGYLIATKNARAVFVRMLLKNPVKLVWRMGQMLIAKPHIIMKLFSFSLPAKAREVGAELQFMAILPEFQRNGLGSTMLKILKWEFSKLGISCYKVGTKRDSQVSNQFYRKHGFRFLYSTKMFGDSFNYYFLDTTRSTSP
jgi:ribosomal protein S18 acetylase RimI-like enzyme